MQSASCQHKSDADQSLAQILLVVCVIIWLIIAAGTVRGALSGKMFFAPCLGTDLYLMEKEDEKRTKLIRVRSREESA